MNEPMQDSEASATQGGWPPSCATLGFFCSIALVASAGMVGCGSNADESLGTSNEALDLVVTHDTQDCYSASDDKDGDGYARKDATKIAVPVSKSQELSCPPGYVRLGNDCNDANALIHPRATEQTSNALDDNCNGSTDEPAPLYDSQGWANTPSSFDIVVRLNNAAAINAQGSLYADIEVAALKDSNYPHTQTLVPITTYYPTGSYARFTVTGLEANTVYQARVLKLYSTKAGTGGLGGLIQNFAIIRSVSDQKSDWYYTTTTGTVGTSATRTAMLLLGFSELGRSDTQLVGYRGYQPDGTRYAADLGENWCSEFYVWTSQTWLKDIAGVDPVDKVVDYFEGYDAYYPSSEIPLASRGDFLPLDTNDDDKKNHSARFLAYDLSEGPGYVWTLEGNSGNQVKVKRRAHDAAFKGLGRITVAMIK